MLEAVAPKPLADRIAVVTWAGRGIGRETAILLARDGACVVVNDLDEAEATGTVDEILAIGGEAIAVVGDITDRELPGRLLTGALAAFGDVHIVVNNAGYIWNGSMLKHTDEQWAAMLDVHASSPFRILRTFGVHFRACAGRENGIVCRKVVNVSSISGYYGAALQLSYSTAKAAIIGMTRSLAKEWGRYNVTVNCVALGYIATRLNAVSEGVPDRVTVGQRSVPVGLDPETHALIERLTPLGRFGTPREAAGAIYLLCRPEADYVSGQILGVNGGLVY
jgi:3-oxoacyl-[acyl-carrier protein] reductase